MKVAVIGVGSIGMRHASNLLVMGHTVSVIDTHPRTMKLSELSKKLATSDAAVICVPTAQHMSVLKVCIRKKLPVYIEKPVASQEDLGALRRLAKKPDLPTIMVGYQLRFHPEIRRYAKAAGAKAIDSGNLFCACNMDQWVGESGRGNFLSEMSHEIDLALHFGAGPLVVWDVNAPDKWAYLGFDGGWAVELLGSSNKYDRTWSIYGGSSTVECAFSDPAELGNDMYVAAMSHFLDAVKNNRQPTYGCTLQQGIAVMDVIAQVTRCR